MKVTVLGCGASGGVPLVTGNWGACDPLNPKNRRQRSSVLVEIEGKNILIDASPDLRSQFLQSSVTSIDAVIITHAHADHIFGLPDLRPFYEGARAPIPVYADEKTLQDLKKTFTYAFEGGAFGYQPFLTGHCISSDSLNIGGILLRFFQQDHGVDSKSLGIRINNFAYSTDMNHLPVAALNELKNLDLWIVDALQREEHPTHSHLEKTKAYIEQLAPKRAILTHLSHKMDYESLMRELPPSVEPAYDSMVVYL